MRRIAIALMLSAGCFSERPEASESTTIIGTTATMEESSSSDGGPIEGPDIYHGCLANADCEDVAGLGTNAQCSAAPCDAAVCDHPSCSFECSHVSDCPATDRGVVACDPDTGMCRFQEFTDEPYSRCENDPTCECKGDPVGSAQCVLRCSIDVDCPEADGKCVDGQCLIACDGTGNPCQREDLLSSDGHWYYFRCPAGATMAEPSFCGWASK